MHHDPQKNIQFTLSFEGNDSDRNLIDYYDVAQALTGFQRSIALTTHLVLNSEIITQAPSLKGAKIYAFPAEQGSWKSTAVISFIGMGIYNVATLENNSPLGHIVYSLYDYVVSESLGVHVDYNKSLGQLYEEAKKYNIKVKPVTQSQADSLLEKCSTAIGEMHRPIYKNKTAESANIYCTLPDRPKLQINTKLTLESYDFLFETRITEVPEQFFGRVSSYNSNTYKGRVFIPEFGRPVVFELNQHARNQKSISLITSSLSANAVNDYADSNSSIKISAFRNTSRSGHLKSLIIITVG
ncbi:hypothetical protein RO575_20895 [Methylomonas sp. MO1]|uniref:DUF7946 domain-containing protein n=1 Tax=Methylomonas sp. MO1 TaxID=3073619 RepID=UPI0028A31070|nr:hypothetical protein [Methylomonas sp. MO1]MDT4292028.1 hypothetical protein [Methylomonas sp. MO1]